MTSKTYYIFRHGETYATRDGTPYILDPNPPILETAIPSIKKLGEYLKDKKTQLYLTSEFLRCKMTSNIVGKIIGSEFEEEPLLNEHTTEPELATETFKSFKQRINKLTKQIQNSEYFSYSICTHSSVASALSKSLVGEKFTKESIVFGPQPGELIIILNKKVTIRSFNQD